MHEVSIVWFKHGDSNESRPPYMSVWRYRKFYQVFWSGEERYEKLVPVLNLLPYHRCSFNSTEYKLSEEELASIFGDVLDVTSCDENEGINE